MRSALRIAAIVLVLLVLLVPLATYASGGPCPDDPDVPCDKKTPPLYVVINRSFEDLDRPGTGCQPIILKHPDCKDCCNEGDNACGLASSDLETRVCPMLVDKVDWVSEAQTAVVYEMCCNCKIDPEGVWRFKVRILDQDGNCPIDPENPGCYEGLPAGTGIDLPAPLIVGGLAVMGAGLLAAGVVVRRRTLHVA